MTSHLQAVGRTSRPRPSPRALSSLRAAARRPQPGSCVVDLAEALAGAHSLGRGAGPAAPDDKPEQEAKRQGAEKEKEKEKEQQQQQQQQQEKDGPLEGAASGDEAEPSRQRRPPAAGVEDEPEAGELRLLELAAEQEPEELEFRLLWWARRGDWAQVEELAASRARLAELEAVGRTRLRTARSEGSLWSPLHYVARDNRWALVERLARAGCPVEARAHDRLTPLHLAATFLGQRGPDCDACLRALLAAGASPELKGGPRDQSALHQLAGKASLWTLPALCLVLERSAARARLEPDAEGNIALFLAIQAGNEASVQELLRELAREQLHYKRLINDDQAIHIATKQKDIEILKLLMEAGSSLDAQNGRGQTALHLAAEQQLEEFVRLLCQAGADPDVQDKEHRSPLHLATALGHQRIMDILSEKFKASIMHRTKDGSTLMHLASSAYNAQAALSFIRKGIPIHMPNKEGARCIHIASIRGHVEVVKEIVARGENVDSRTKDGFTPLHLAVKFGKRELVEALLGLGADLQMKALRGGETALHLATLVEGGQECVDLLIRSGAAVDAVEARGETPLHFAARANNIEAVRLLLDDGAQMELQNELGENLLHVAVHESYLELIRDTIIQHIVARRQVAQARRLINQPNRKGESALHYAASLTGQLAHQPDEEREIARALLVNGADPFLQSHGLLQTPVHYCCQAGNTNILQEILAHLDQQLCRSACNQPAQFLWTPLFYACHHGHPGVIRMLINQTARIDVFDEHGEAPLHVAVRRGHQQVVDILLEHSAFVNVRNKPGMTPLHIAAQLGHNNMVLQLVREHGAILDAMTLIKQIPLHLAAESGRLEVCQSLLSLGSDLRALDNQSQTPLHLAARRNHVEVLKLFLGSNAELITMANKNGYTCAHIAAMNGSLEAVKELLRFNRDAVISGRIKRTNSSALHLASENGNAEIVRLLLASGAKPSDENAAGDTALHLAARNGHVKVLHTIRSADWKICSRRNGLTALHLASSEGQTEFVAEMLRCRVPGGIRSERSSIEPRSDYGLTPLHLACMNGHEGVVRMLLNSAGVQVDSVSELNRTIPVHLAAQGGHLLVAGLLISRSTEGLTQADAHGRTALHLAAAHGHRDMVGLLIGQGAPINFRDDRGWSPLHHAAEHGYLEVVRLLTESGADPATTCELGRVPICMAASSGHKQVLSYLLRKEHDALELMQDKHFLIDLMACSKQHANMPLQEFILINDQAPIDVAVRLAKCYEILAEKDKDRARDLVVARDLCDQVATDLLTIVASMNQSTSLLKSYDRARVQFLDVLIELDRKDVVSQHSVQRYLSDVWIGSLNWPLWRFILLFFGFLLCPPAWAACSCPAGAGRRLARVPVIKFMSYLVSHLFFILLLTLTTINPWLPVYKWQDPVPPWHEWLLLLWFAGILTTTLSNPPDKAGFGSIKLVNLALGSLACLIHLLGFLLPLAHLPYVLFARNQLLALVLLLSFVELLNFLTFHHLFGPWAVIIQDLMKDMMRFLVIMAIFLVGFSLTVSAIYMPVFDYLQLEALPAAAAAAPSGGAARPGGSGASGAHNQSQVHWSVPSAGLDFQSPLFTFEMLFYSLFGLVEPDEMPPLQASPAVSKVIMKLVFGVYMMITVVVLINLLIAMMSNTYQRIEARSDIEWKFGRAKLIRNMIRTSPTPSPLILLLGVWVDWYRKWRRRQQERAQVERMAVAAFNRKASVSEAAGRAARHWMSRAPQLSARRQADELAGRALPAGARPSEARSLGGACAPSPAGRRASQGQLIHEAVAWALVARKYWESAGVALERDEEPGNIESGSSAASQQQQSAAPAPSPSNTLAEA